MGHAQIFFDEIGIREERRKRQLRDLIVILENSARFLRSRPCKLTFVIASLPHSTSMTMMREIEEGSSKLDSMIEIEEGLSKQDSMNEIEEGSSELDL